MRGDCSIRIDGLGFSPEEIADCAARTGLLAIEIDLPGGDHCECAACRASGSTTRTALSPAEIHQLLAQARAIGCRRVIFIDSDPGPYSNLHAVIDDAITQSLEVELFCERTRMTAALAKSLYERGVAVAVRLDSLGRDDQIAAVDELRRAGYAKGSGPRLAIRILVDDANADQIPAIWRWARTRAVEPRVQIMTPRDARHPLPRTMTPDRARELFESLGRIDEEEFHHPWELPPALTGRSCKRHLFACHVTPCGLIFACVGVTIPLGDIRAEPLAEILSQSEVLENLRAFGQKVKEPCRTCSQSTDCYGCRGSAYQLTGDYLAGDQLCWKAQGAAVQVLPIRTDTLIPHGPSIRMVHRLLRVDERRAQAEFIVPDDSCWVDEAGVLDETAHIEMIAQSFAALHGFHLPAEDLASHRGMLLGVKNLVIAQEARAGDRLIIHIHKVTRFGGFGVVEGEVRRDDETLVASAQIKVWRPEKESMQAVFG